MSADILNGFSGWGSGYTYTTFKSREDEVKQGGNYYFAAGVQSGQVGILGSLVDKLSDLNPSSPLRIPAKIFSNCAPFVSFPVHLFFASVKQGHYEDFAKRVNRFCDDKKHIKQIPIRLPEKLSARSVKVISFLADNIGNMIRVAVIASSVALIVFGNPFFGAGILVAVTYDTIDQMGFVPRKISLFMETYMPAVSSLGMVIGGSIPMRILGLVQLPFYIFSSATRFVHQQIEAGIHKFFINELPTLKEIDAPLVVNRELDFNAIKEILCGSDDDYKINPAHCSKAIKRLSDLPVDTNFDDYLTLFDKINWKEKYMLVSKRLNDDERFIAHLKNKFPEVSDGDLKNKFQYYLEKAAQNENISKEDLVAHWLRDQMEILVSLLKGKKRTTGTQQDLAEAIDYCSKILPFLKSIETSNSVEFEDVLLKLAVEAGNYCSRGIKRAAGELISHVISHGAPAEQSDPVKDYELKIERSLLEMRRELMESTYQKMNRVASIPSQIGMDVHGFDAYRLYLSLGLYPLTEYERGRFNLNNLLIWETFCEVRQDMYTQYKSQLAEVVEGNGFVNFGVYIQQVINSNPKLSDAEKEKVLEMFTDCNNNNWTPWDTQNHFCRLMLVMLGVLKKV